jgi:hypothetical protein
MDEIIKVIYALDQRDFWDYVPIIFGVLSSIAMMATFWLANRIYRRIDKPIIEKQLGKVYELIEVLQNTSIEFSLIQLNKTIKSFEVKFFNGEKKKVEISDVANNLIIQKSYYDKLEFIKYKDDPFVPEKIAKLLGYFEVTFKNKFQYNMTDYYVIGGSWGEHLVQAEQDDYYQVSGSLQSCQDYLDKILETKKEIQKWLNKPRPNLNLE